jgi:tRNA threonylcarbamoyladenosine biosynthesis protein TsaB
MLTLALDTTSEQGGVAIYRDSDCLALVANQGPPNTYSITLFEMVPNLLRQAKLQLREIDLFTVACGPGSFTGIRVGIATTQAWARAFGRPVCGVSILEALVETAPPEEEWAVPILDAHRGEFYIGRFRSTGRHGDATSTAFESDGGGWVVKANSLAAFCESHLPAGATVACLVREHDHAARALQETLPNSYRFWIVAGPLVGAIARLGLEARRRGRSQSPAELDACYIRRPDAELNWRDK